MKKIFVVVLLSLTIIGCGEYQNALKTEDVSVKYPLAEKLYEQGKYMKAIRLFEQIAPGYRGKPQSEKMFYLYSQSLYKTKQYNSAAYQFESFVKSYPRSEKVQEAAYLSVESYLKKVPEYGLDQADTYVALEKAQNFMYNYSDSEYAPQVNDIIKKLTINLERKHFEIAKQYYSVGRYTTAIKALDVFLSEHPGTVFRDDAMFYKFDAAYLYAINSVVERQKERAKEAIEYYEKLMAFSPENKYKKEAVLKYEELKNLVN